MSEFLKEYIIAPGASIKEALEASSMSVSELALKLETIFHISASFWNNLKINNRIKKIYQLYVLYKFTLFLHNKTYYIVEL